MTTTAGAEVMVSSAAAAPVRSEGDRPGVAAAQTGAPPFRFYDNRQKYLAFVNTCNEKAAIAARAAQELSQLHPSPPSFRLFDAGMGDATVLSRVMRSMHRYFPTVPLLVVAKEISLEDVRLGLEKMVDRHALLKALKEELGRETRDFSLAAPPDEKSVFRYAMHTLPSEIGDRIGTSTLFAAWNAAIYVNQIEDERLDAVMTAGSYLEVTQAVLQKYGGLWFNDETFVVSRKRG